MSQITNTFKLGYFELGDYSDPTIESNRWRTIDSQMHAIFYALGNGVVDGWNFIVNDVDELTLSIDIGNGHINYVAVESTSINNITLVENSINYIYAVSAADSYYNKTVTFQRSSIQLVGDSYLYLGYVDTNLSTVSPIIKEVNIDDRVYISFKQQILNLIKDHRHIGGTDNPAKINLATDVQGFLRTENIEELDASFIGSGVIDEAVLPQIDHITGLTNNGILTHSQLDTFVQILSNDGNRLMGETASVDLLKLILAVKHIYPTIDDYFVNEIAFIPGISPDDFVDQVNTTADVDYRTSAEGGQHTITGTPAQSTSIFTKRWDSFEEFSEATLDDIVIVGDSLKLSTKENKVYIDDFTDVSDWEAITSDVSSISSSFQLDTILGVSGGKVAVETADAEIAFILKKTFNAQDWSSYNKIVFLLYCDSLKHGDIFFYLYDSEYGSQGSYVNVLDRNSITINQDTLNLGWREIVIDISNYNRENITAVGFYTSTTSGWKIEDAFSFNVNEIYLTSGNIFLARGTAIFSYGNDFQYKFSNVRWDASLPNDTYIRVRTRVSNNEDMSDAYWSAFLTESNDSILLPSDITYQYIDIEVSFESNTVFDKTPQLYSLYLDADVNSDDYTFDFDTRDAWESGTLRNIDTSTVDGSIRIKNISDLGNYVYASNGSLKQLNNDGTEKTIVYGNSIPKSFNQLLNSEAAGFGDILSVEFGTRDSFIVSDTDNDRVVEVDKSGNVLWGVMGHFIDIPINPYINVTTESVVDSEYNYFNCLGSYYNISDNKLYIMFDKFLENIYTSETFNPLNMFLKAGTRRIYLDKTKVQFSLFGVNEDSYTSGSGISEYLKGSNILVAELSESDSVSLSGVIESKDPYLVMASPTINQVISASSLTIQFVTYNCNIGLDEYGIRLQIDSDEFIDLRTSSSYVVDSISDGLHTINAYLIDSEENIVANSNCSVSSLFFVETGVLSESIISINSLLENEILSSGNISVDFTLYNVPSGYYLRYIIDSENYVQYDDVSPLQISGLSGGNHTLRFYLSDINNNVLTGSMSDVSVDFIVVSKNTASFSLVVGSTSIKDINGKPVYDSITDIYITKIKPFNVYSPIDSRIVLSELNAADSSSFNVLIAKVATPSNKIFFNQLYKDGQSVIEVSESCDLILSNNTAIIASNKTFAKEFCGSAYKYDSNELHIGDAYGKRALIVKLDLTNKTSSIIWEYDSDKIISDFNKVPNSDFVNRVTDLGILNDAIYIKRDTNITWYNDTNETIRILSGETNYDQFYLDPDFDNFGLIFDSEDILPGEYYTFRDLNIGTCDYFVYPYIYTGKIYCVDSSISPDDSFIIVENDQNGSSYLNRIIKVDVWGNLTWSFGESFVSTIKDAKPYLNNEIIITV